MCSFAPHNSRLNILLLRALPLRVPTLRRRASNASDSLYNTFKPKTAIMFPPGTFENRVAFLTGGATGFGKCLANSLASLGANVFIVSRNEDVLKASCKEFAKVTGTNAVAYAVADVCHVDAVHEAVDACRSRFGLPNLIVNNAAGNFIGPTERLSPNTFGSVVDIVLKGTANVTLEIGKALIAAKQSGTFLFVSTAYAQTGSAFVVPSAAAKAGLEAMVKSLAAEWGRYNLRFNSIAPGPIYTTGAFSRLDPTGQFQKEAAKRIPAGRLGLPEEFTNLALYLLSDYSSWMSGEIVRLDGGEVPSISGEFNMLTRLLKDSDWDKIEKLMERSPKSS